MRKVSRLNCDVKLGAKDNIAIEAKASRDLRAPDFLPDAAKKIFDELAIHLQQLGRVISGDVYAIAALAKTIYDWQRLIEHNEHHEAIEYDEKGRAHISAALREERALRRAILRMSEELGLSPRSRQYVKISSSELVDVNAILDELVRDEDEDEIGLN